MRNRELFFTSGFGLGFLPFAPGTWGSLLPLAVYLALGSIAPFWVNSLAMVFLAAAGFWVCVRCGRAVIGICGEKDPSQVVADEVSGQSVALLAASFVQGQAVWTTAVAAFVLFRFFDIVKIYPVRRLEKLPAGWGIAADDVMAGIQAAVVLVALCLTGVFGHAGGFFDSAAGPLKPGFAAFLGVVQGLTEFLPVSSSGHLVLFENFQPELNPDSREMLLFDLSLHLATVAAILVVYAGDIRAFTGRLLDFRQSGADITEIYKKNHSVRILILAVVSTAVTFGLYLVFKEPLENARKLWLVGLMWLVTGTLLLLSDIRKKTRMSLREFGFLAAILVGIAQAAAILPGISRSGATVCTAILLGLHRKWALEYSFLIGIIAICGAAVVKTAEEIGKTDLSALPPASVITGFAASFVVGVISLKILIRASRAKKLKYFAFYCYILAVFVCVYFLLNR